MSKGMFLNLTDSRDGVEARILEDLVRERDRQQQKWGPQTHSISE